MKVRTTNVLMKYLRKIGYYHGYNGYRIKLFIYLLWWFRTILTIAPLMNLFELLDRYQSVMIDFFDI